ncbi:MAG: hypothetical protein U0350_49255 [Caldilineaceae bacterium]
MSEPQRLPRKFLAQIRQAQDDLRLLAHQAGLVCEQLRNPRPAIDAARTLLREMEGNAYRIALELAELKVVEDCGGCPCAPPRISAQVHLLLLADELERQADLARQQAGETAMPLHLYEQRVRDQLVSVQLACHE